MAFMLMPSIVMSC